MIDVLMPVVLIVGAYVIVVAQIIQMMREVSGSAPASELGFVGSFNTLAVVVVLLAMVEVVANIIALLLLARITASLSVSQKIRRNWVVQNADRRYGAAVPSATPAAAPAATMTLPAASADPLGNK